MHVQLNTAAIVLLWLWLADFRCCTNPMEACRQLKEEYDDCFNVWFSQKFLKGDNDDSMCAQLLKVYKQCVEKSMKENHIELKDVDLDVLGTEKEAKVPEK